MSASGGKQVKVWAGRFPSRDRVDAFFQETYADGSGPEESQAISEFAAAQGAEFYDHDFLEFQFAPASTRTIRPLLEDLSYSGSYIDAVVQAYEQKSTPANTVVLFFGEELESPRSVSGADFELHYLGAFDYDPRAESVAAADLGVSPATILLQLESPGAVRVAGKLVREVPIDSRGLIIGRGGVEGDGPYVDLAPLDESEGVAQVQMRMYQDAFEQWVVEDQGNNGLTSIQGEVFNLERSMPWHKTRIKVGPAVFLWNCFPGREDR